MHPPNIARLDQRGSLVMIVMMVLFMVTIIGLAALRSTNTELQVAANDVGYKRAFYAADSGISYALEANLSIEPPWPNLDPNDTSNELTVPADAPYRLFFLRVIELGPPKKIEIEAISEGGRANAAVVCGIQLPVPPGALPNPGEAGTY